MIFRAMIYLLLPIFFITGCGTKGGPGGFLSYTSTIPAEKINATLAKKFPVNKKTTFGSVKLKAAALRPMSDGGQVALSVAFTLVSYEIPEGIDGVLALSSKLRYAPETKTLHLHELTPRGIKFSSASLASYVSKGARDKLGVISMQVLADVPVHQMEKSFSAKFIKQVTVHKGKIVVVYGL